MPPRRAPGLTLLHLTLLPLCVGSCGGGTHDPSTPWQVWVREGTVARTRSDGTAWDSVAAPDDLPDPKVCITVGSARHCSREAPNTNAPTWDEVIIPAVTGAELSAGVFFEYLDVDAVTDETICHGTTSFPAGHLELGEDWINCPDELGIVVVLFRAP